MLEVAKLTTEPHPDDIKVVEELLESMKLGKVSDFVLLWHQNGGELHTMYQANRHTMCMLGELRCLERDIIDGCVDTRHHNAGDHY